MDFRSEIPRVLADIMFAFSVRCGLGGGEEFDFHGWRSRGFWFLVVMVLKSALYHPSGAGDSNLNCPKILTPSQS